LQNETLFEPLHKTTPKRDKIPRKKNRNLLVHTVELSAAVVKVDIKVRY